MKLRDYQIQLSNEIDEKWASGAKNVLGVLPTGGGKTVIFSNKIQNHNGAACAIAHRQELVSQISLTLARDSIRHSIIGPEDIIRTINRLHVEKYGKSYYHPSAQVAVAGIDTLIRRKERLANWCKKVGLWVIDEGHHVLRENKWGSAAEMFPNARGLLVTATPERADGKGLGRHHDGVVDAMVMGPNGRELINRGYLTDYRIFAPTNSIDLTNVKIGANGDFTQPTLTKAVRKSKIVGDVIEHYLKIAPGKLGITFASDIKNANDIADKFNEMLVPAAVVSAKTHVRERAALLRKFENRELLQLVNVDLFGEGFDLPALEVVSMARPTQSYGLYVQQFGRVLRIMRGKAFGIVIDHVGNVARHGLPDRIKSWSLDRRDKRKKSKQDDIIPVKVCPACTSVYEAVYPACPYCGFKPLPAVRTGPEFVDGDLAELDAATLARMRGEIVDINLSVTDYLHESSAGYLPKIPAMAAAKRFVEKQEAQKELRDSMALWAGLQKAHGMSDSERYRLFYHTFKIDVLSAQALCRKDAKNLKNLIDSKITNA